MRLSLFLGDQQRRNMRGRGTWKTRKVKLRRWKNKDENDLMTMQSANDRKSNHLLK